MRSLYFYLILSLLFLPTFSYSQVPRTVSGDDLNPKILLIDQKKYIGTEVYNPVLVDIYGKTNTLTGFTEGKVKVIVLFFTKCKGLCPTQVEHIKQLIDRNDKNYYTVFLSFDKTDTLNDLRNFYYSHIEKNDIYHSHHPHDGVSHEYHLPKNLGNMIFAIFKDEIEIKKFTDSVGFKFFYSQRDETFVHPTTTIFVSPSGKVSRYLFGTTFKENDFNLAVREANIEKFSLEKIVDYATLACYTYDHTTGKYQFNYVIIFPLSGVFLLGITVLILLFFKRGIKNVSG